MYSFPWRSNRYLQCKMYMSSGGVIPSSYYINGGRPPPLKYRGAFWFDQCYYLAFVFALKVRSRLSPICISMPKVPSPRLNGALAKKSSPKVNTTKSPTSGITKSCKSPPKGSLDFWDQIYGGSFACFKDRFPDLSGCKLHAAFKKYYIRRTNVTIPYFHPKDNHRCQRRHRLNPCRSERKQEVLASVSYMYIYI